MLDVANMAVSAGVNGAIGLVFYFAVQRNMEKVDRLNDRLKKLEDDRVQGLENTMVSHIEQNNAARLALVTDLRELDRRMVSRVECEKLHAQTEKRHSDNAQKVYDAALKLEALGTQTVRLVGWLGEQQRDIIAAKEDIKVVLTRVEDLKERMP